MMTSTHTLSSVSVIINHFLQTWAKADVRRCIKIQQVLGMSNECGCLLCKSPDVGALLNNAWALSYH